ncbi:MAG: phytoene desaturase family protein, partial [Janthinobacterium lividum]
GVEIVLDAPVARVLTANGRATGVRLVSGEEITAKIVVANVTPKLLFDKLVDPADLTPAFRHRIAATRYGSGSFRINAALRELPDFTTLPGPGEHHRSGIIIAPSLDYMDRAYTDARAHGWSREPIVEMTIPSTVDPGLAPPGMHVASLFAQQFVPVLPDGRSWDDERAAAADAIVATVTAAAPNFRDSIVAMTALSPLDLERKFGLTGGDIFHGSMGLDQLWSARPVLGNASYRAPVRGLYLCGAGSHPGGGVTGAPGHNAAHEILADRRWWRQRWPS